MNTPINIPKNISTNNDLDFHYLRDLGISYIETLGGSLWTDLNTHDPGRTMLEMLCYAITDLGMRIDQPITNLLTGEDSDSLASQFYKASEIFPTKPVTALDYRKLFIDIEGVRNCWLRIAKETVYVDCKQDKLSYKAEDFNDTLDAFKDQYEFKGLYNILVDFDPFDEALTSEEQDTKREEIISVICERYHANRNLCEDLISINKVDEEPITVCANIEVHTEADEELVHAKVLTAISEYFATTLRFYTIKEMLDKGYTPDQIFDGPTLDHGFIDIEELKAADLRSEVRLSDLMKIIINIEGVKLIKDISIGFCDENLVPLNDWVLCIQPDKKPVLCAKSTFNYSKGVLPLNINEAQVKNYLEILKEDALLAQEVGEDEKTLPFPEGTFLAPETYTTIQNDFPDTYGIGTSGLADTVTDERRAQAKQLKTYLLFFDKILATYFKHLGKVKEVLAINSNLSKTYFTQAVEDIAGFDELVKDYPQNDDDALTEKLFEQLDNNIERRNAILDHLLARFAEKFGDYAFLMKALYGSATDEIVLANKEEFLNDYIAISSERGAAFNYFNQKEENLWDTDNISGVQKRIARLLGIKNYDRRTLSSSFVDVFSLISDEDKTVFSWHIHDENDNIILSANTAYNNLPAANKALYQSVLQIIQTQTKVVEEAFAKSVITDAIIENVQVHISESGKYFFDIIDTEKDSDDPDYIIAKQSKFYDTQTEVRDAILQLISFMKFKFTEEGFFLVEHILLRPNVVENDNTPFLPICTNNCEDDCGIDPYSYRVSIVIPGYTYRFSNPDFRKYMEQIIKEELPAHILPKICWIGYRENDLENLKEEYLQQLEDEKQMALQELDEQIAEIEGNDDPQEEKDIQIAALEAQKEAVIETIEDQKAALIERLDNQTNDLETFETTYYDYLLAKTKAPKQEQPIEIEPFIEALGNLNTIYPVGRLLDCSDESDDLEGKIILGQTNIGTL